MNQTKPMKGAPASDPAEGPSDRAKLAVLLAADPNFQASCMAGIAALGFDACAMAIHLEGSGAMITPSGELSRATLGEDSSTIERASRILVNDGVTMIPASATIIDVFRGAKLMICFVSDAHESKPTNAVASAVAGVAVHGDALVLVDIESSEAN